jgi:hypothetical protein
MQKFNSNGLVVASSSNVYIDVKDLANRLEETLEGTAIIDNNKTWMSMRWLTRWKPSWKGQQVEKREV